MTEDQLEANQESRADYNKRTFGLVFGQDEASTSKKTAKSNEVRIVHTLPKIKQKLENVESLKHINSDVTYEMQDVHQIQRKVLDGIDKTCQKIHDNDFFERFMRNKVNPDSQPMHVFYGENQNSNPNSKSCSNVKQEEGVLENYGGRDTSLEITESEHKLENPENNANPEFHELLSKNENPDTKKVVKLFTQKVVKLTDAFKTNIISKLWPAVGAANITNDQAKTFFDDHSKFFESTLCELFLNAYRHGNFKNLDTNEPPETVCKNLAKYSALEFLPEFLPENVPTSPTFGRKGFKIPYLGHFRAFLVFEMFSVSNF